MVILESDICSFLSHVQAKRYEAAYEKLQFMLYAHDANMCCSARRQLTDLLKSAAMELLRCMKIYSVEENLLLLKFLKSCFQSTFDAESRLVIVYEELLLRDAVCVEKRYLGVTDDEWMCFARDCLQHGFYHNAAKAYDMIISRVRSLKLAQDTMKVILEEVTKEKQFALQLADKTSVEVQALAILKRKNKFIQPTEFKASPLATATTKCMSAIERRNAKKLKFCRGY